MKLLTKRAALLLTTAATILITSASWAKEVTLLNVSYDPTRELYREFNTAFAKHWKAKTGDDVKVEQSHGGSGSQARAVLDGLKADVVTLALAGDIDPLAKNGKLLADNWASLLPNNSAPYTSTIVFLVRKGNPKAIKDWNDLTKSGIEVITPNPKTSGGARWNYLAAWAYAKKHDGTDAAAQEFVKKIYKNVPVLDSGARGSTTTFVQRGIGDVLLTWENEAHLAIQEAGTSDIEIVYPSYSILAEPPVAVVSKNAAAKGTTSVADAYLNFLYTKEGQEIAAKNFYRPRDPQVASAFAKNFPGIEFATISDFGGWSKAQPEHFGDGGIFDKIYATP
jgi:sulfate transport system substrate-binding protein